NDVARLATAMPSVIETGKWGMKTWAVKDKSKAHGFVWERPLRKNELAATPTCILCLSRMRVGELRDLIVEAWLARAPERLVKEYLAEGSR
ncbi:MAG TPA: hypothetical protein VMG98_08555, partial [Verrucomicrobiae bacterium]|nr:hypothetical protein [Verrucomicrobiae bacterium]